MASVTIQGIAKGSGMIAPNMATMLAYIFTDADIASATLDTMLRDAVHVSFNSVVDQQEYPIVSLPAPRFYQVSRLYVTDTEGALRPIPRVNPSEAYCLRAPKTVTTMKLYYFPCAPTFSAGSETFDGINGWEEHTIQTAAIFIKAKKEDDTGQYRARKREIEERMKTMANRNRDEPPRVVRRARHLAWMNRGYAIPYASGVTHWDIRGANLELFA